MTRVATYSRVSLDIQADEGKSIPAQQEEMKEFADARDWNIVAELVDPGLSGTNMNRPGLQMALDMADKELTKILTEASERFKLTKSVIRHRSGQLAVGENIVFIGVSSPHREDGFNACRYIIDEIKKRVPLFKKEITPDGEEIWYEGAEGADVHGFLIKPLNFDPEKKYPLMVRVHGGPQQMFGYAYRTEYALFSGADYAVFFCNPRGSTGYGQEFCDGIRGDWGGKVIEDIRSGVSYVLENYPWVDGDRVGAWGGSYGGFVCNWLQGHNEDGMFSVLVSHAGEADQWSAYGSTEELWFPEWELLGTPWDNPDLYDELSPIRYAKSFSTPHLIIHGELDYRVPITGGEQMFTALQRQGVPSKMIRFPDEDHWIQRPQNNAFWYESILDWFDQWLKRDGKEKEEAAE